MAVQSFAEAHAQIFGGQPTPPQLANPSGKVTLFQQAHQTLIQNQQSKPQVQPISAPKIATAPVQKQPSSPLFNAANAVVQGIQHMPLPTDLIDQKLFHNPGQTLQSPVPDKQLLPQAKQTIKTQNAEQFVKNIAGGVLNAIPQGIKSASDLGTSLGSKTATPQNVAGNMADIVMAASMFFGGEAAAPVMQGIKEAAGQGIKSTAIATGKALAKESIVGGGGFGLLSGISSGRDITNIKDYINNLWQNVKAGVEIAGVTGTAIHVALPLAKGATAKAGAIFVTDPAGKAKVDQINMSPEVAQATVLHDGKLEKTPTGKAVMKTSLEAQQRGGHVAITPDTKGEYALPSGEKVNVSLTTPYDPSMATPETKLPFTPSTHISGEDTKTEADFAKQLQSNYPGAVEKYNALPDSEGGKILNVDTARELSSAYQQDRTGKSAAVHEPASAFVNKLYEDKLKEPITEGKDTVLFTAGGTGAGKSTAIATIPEVRQVKENAQFVYDTTASSAQSMIGKVQKAVDSGRNVTIAYVLRDPIDALENGSLPRAMRTGRAVPLEAHLSSHVNSLESIIKIADHFKDNEHVDIGIIDNNHGKGNAHLVPLDSIRSLRYNKDELRGQLHDSLNKQYETNKISEQVYNATKGESSPTTVQTTVTSHAASNGEKPQSESSSRTETSSTSRAESKPESRGSSKANSSELSSNTKNDQLTTPIEPVKNSSDQKVSSAQKHLLERLAETDPERYQAIVDKNGEIKYNVNHAKDDLEHAAKLIETDPQKAYETAMGYRGFPEKGTMNAVAIILSDRAAKEKNYPMVADLERVITLRSTRAGQEIAALKGRNTENSPHGFMQQVLQTRLARLGKTVTTGIKTDVKTMVKEMGSVKERAVAKIDKATLQLQKELRKQQVMIKSAQSILDDLTCK